MNINDILKLNNEIESLNIIQDYISRSISQVDFETAVYMYLRIADFNNLNELIISEGTKSLNKIINTEPTKYREQIYKFMFEASLALEKYDDSKKYLQSRKALLPIMNNYLSLLDELKLYSCLNKDDLEILLKLKVEILPLDTNIYVLEKLYDYYFNSKMYVEALDILIELKELALKDIYEEHLIIIKYHLNEFIEVVDLSIKYLKSGSDCSRVVVYYIDALTKLNKLRLATTLEAEYEELIDQIEDIEFKSFAYNIIINLYTELENQISINLYKKKLKALNRVTKPKEVKEEVVLKEVIKVKEIQTQSLVSSAKYLEHFEWVLNWLIDSHHMSLKLPFREYLREIFIKINEKVDFKEAIIYADNNTDSNFYNYKKERLYDKKIIKEYIEDTIIKETLTNKESIFGIPSNLLSKKDVLTQKAFDESIKYIYSFYINDFTVLVFYLDKELEDPSIYYELFNGISYLVNMRIIDEANSKNLQLDGRKLSAITSNNVIPTRVLTEFRSSYNDVASKLFNIDSKYHLELFLRQMSLEEAKNYDKAIKRLFTYPNETKILTYNFNNLVIKEYLFAFKNGDEIIIYSYFIDITEYTQRESTLIENAIICNETKLNNKNSLLDDLANFVTSKATFVIIELNNDLASIYGNTMVNKFFVEFAHATKKHFENYQVYRYDFNQLIVIFDFNDIRTVNRELNNYFSVVAHLKSKVLKYERFEAKAGVLRYPSSSDLKNITKLFVYLDVSLNKARLSHELDYVHFIQADYEKEVFENEVIEYLNTALENNQMSIKFKQIIDVSNNSVWNYESQIYLPNINIDDKYLTIIARRRKKLVDLEYFHIEEVCRFLKELQKETNYFIKLTIPISKETFQSNGFNSFIIGTLKKYKVSSEYIRFVVNMKDTNTSDSLKIDELIKFGISVDTTSLESALKNEFNAVHLKLNKMNIKYKTYYKEINQMLNSFNIALIIKEVNTREDRDVLKGLGISYIEGKLYQEITPNEIIDKVKEAIK